MEYYTPSEVAEILKLTTRTIYKRLQSGELPHIRVTEKCIRISSDDLKEFAEKFKVA